MEQRESDLWTAGGMLTLLNNSRWMLTDRFTSLLHYTCDAFLIFLLNEKNTASRIWRVMQIVFSTHVVSISGRAHGLTHHFSTQETCFDIVVFCYVVALLLQLSIFTLWSQRNCCELKLAVDCLTMSSYALTIVVVCNATAGRVDSTARQASCVTFC